jgi:hypothetical protein
VAALTELVHELNRLNQGETASFFVERFYLDRFIDRTALAIIRGEADRTAALRHFLKDSRNGKWERLQDLHRSGDWGSEDWKADLRVPDAEEARRILFGRSLEAADLFRGEPSVLETRFFLDPALRARLFARVLELLDGDLSPARVGALAEGCLAAIREAGAHDVDRARGDGERAAFLSAPERLRAAHEARAAAIRAAIAREKDRKPPPIILNEVLLRPAAGEPWIEIRNTANEAVSLRGYRLVKAFGRPRDVLRDPAVAAPLDRFGELAPGELRVLKLAAGEVFPAPAGGGFIALYRVEAAAGQGAASPELADALFHGHQTAGVAYGRRGGGPAGAAGEEPWAFLARPTPGAANDADALALPAHDFRQEVARDDAGAVTIALQPRSATAEAPARPEKVVLRHREDGAGEFAETMLSWDDKRFRFSVQLPASPERPRTAYYFLVTQPGGVERTYPLAAPEVTFFIPVHPRVRINEVLPRPGQEEGVPGQDGGIPGQDGGIPGQDGGIPGQKPSPLGEFIEIHNAEETPVDLEGYFLTDSNRNPAKWRLPAGSIVGPKGFIVFYADGLAGGNHTNFKLSNSGEYLGLFGRMEEGNLPVDTLAFRGMRTGESWGASPDGSKNFRAWKDPTPGKRNLPKIPAEFLKKKREEGEAGAAGAEPGGEVPVPVPEEVPKDREGNTKERGGA